MISAVWAKIPLNEIYGLLEATKPEYRHYSPFWGAVALEGGMLKTLRFYGNYSLSTDSQGRPIDIASSTDPIAQLILSLFPSPDGFNFLPNTRAMESAGFLGRHLESVNNIIEILLSKNPDKEALIIDILRPRKNNKFIYNKGPDALSKINAEHFANILLKAHNYHVHEGSIPYPKYTAITVLNAFFISAANKTLDLEKLTFLMKPGFTVSKDLRTFRSEDFDRCCLQMDELIKENGQYPEEIFLVNVLKKAFLSRNIYADVMPYRSNLQIKLPSQEERTFADCTETALRNFLWKISNLPLGLQTFFENVEKENPNVLSDNTYAELKKFSDAPALLGGSTPEAHQEWAKIISGLNRDPSTPEIDKVFYKKEGFFEIGNKYNYEERTPGRIYNYLNVISNLIPDKVLAKSWAQCEKFPEPEANYLVTILHEKLQRLCFLSSPLLSYQLIGQPPYLNLIFHYKRAPYFSLIFTSFHCSAKLLITKKMSSNLYNQNCFENPWLGALLNKPRCKSYPQVFNLACVFNTSLSEGPIYHYLCYFFHYDLDCFQPLIKRWFEKEKLNLINPLNRLNINWQIKWSDLVKRYRLNNPL